MIPDLQNKATNEKYFKSIRYFSHSLKGEKRKNFITQVAEHNIFLAAQCIMSAEKDAELENFLTKKATQWCASKKIEIRVNGFLGLIELNRYDIIYDVISKIEKIEREHRYTISRIIDEIDAENIVKFLRLLVNADVKSLITPIITQVEGKEISFTSEQRAELEIIFYKIQKTKYAIKNILRFHMAFRLSRKCLPNETSLKLISEKLIQKANFSIVSSLYLNNNIPFPFTNTEICQIYLRRNRQSTVFGFADAFFNLESLADKRMLLEQCLRKGSYYTAFFLSLVKDLNERYNLILRFENNSSFSNLIQPFTNRGYPNFDQGMLRDICENYLEKTNQNKEIIVECQVTYVIPKTIFVEILATKQRGSIWIKEFTKQDCDDATILVNIGDKVKAKIIGSSEKYIQLSVLQANQ